MTDEEKKALQDIRGLARAGRIRRVRHAKLRMRQRGVDFADLRLALIEADRCKSQENGRWKVFGEDRDGDELTTVVEIDDGLLVITIF